MARNDMTRLLVLAAFLLFSIASHAPAAEATVSLVDGQSLIADVDARSDQRRLVLRFDSDTATLLRRIAWERVVAVRMGDETLTGDEARASLSDLIAENVLENASSDSQESTVLPPSPTPSIATETDELVFVPAVQSVGVKAYAANFDADVPVDGLAVAIRTYDAWGRLTPVVGTAEIELFGDRRSLARPLPTSRREQFNRLGRWVVQLNDLHFTPGGYAFNLPFQGFNPTDDWSIRPAALVNVRVTIPGEGVYEASDADVRLLPFSPLRNRIQGSTGSRYLPAEATGY